MTLSVSLPGFTFERLLGSGGFAEVYLCTQHLPRRRVAVKVLRDTVADASARARFETEANLMAALSTHPSIVTIHHAAVSADGHPYLVMEYCSRETLAEQCDTRTLSVPEMLQTFVRLAGAIETAHRAGILHRDIKPGNVLATDYGWPALSDFGISSHRALPADDPGALSLPWAPPEAILGHPVDARSDIYALAATAYTVLAGRPPFPPSGDTVAMIASIVRDDVPPLGRTDVPESLERLLRMALSKDAAMRPQSASEFARSLQRIEQDMHLPLTHLDILEATPVTAEADPEAERTEFSGLRARRARSEAPDAPAAEETATEETVLSSRHVADEATRLSPRRGTDEATRLSSRRGADEATRLSSRRGADEATGGDPDDATTLSSRHLAEQTVLSSRHVVDDATVFVARSTPDDETRIAVRRAHDADPPVDAGAPVDDATVLAVRPDTDRPIVNAATAPPATRVASSPADAPVASRVYRIRDDVPTPEIVRAPVAPPVAAPATTGRRRRAGRGALWAGVLIGIGVLGAGAAGIVILWMG